VLFISGTPGTGKTATVRRVADQLLLKAAQGQLPRFRFVEVNGMCLNNPLQVSSTALLLLCTLVFE
jgi:origin recognition complex subunit 1